MGAPKKWISNGSQSYHQVTKKGKMRKNEEDEGLTNFKVDVQCTSRHSQTSEESFMFFNNAPLKDIFMFYFYFPFLFLSLLSSKVCIFCRANSLLSIFRNNFLPADICFRPKWLKPILRRSFKCKITLGRHNNKTLEWTFSILTCQTNYPNLPEFHW